MNMLEVRIITDNIKRLGGFREKEVIKNLTKIELIRDDKEYKIYHFEDSEGNYFEYDFRSQRITN